MEILAKDGQKRQSLNSSSQHACHILNNVIFPIAKELRFEIDITDKRALNLYILRLSAMQDDYIGKMMEEATNPALAVVLKESASKLWRSASQNHHLANPGIIADIVPDWYEYVTIVGQDIYSAHARPNNPAMEKACIIEATEEDLAKREEIKEVCNALNRAFNGNGGLFGGYITIERGVFVPIKNITNYKPLIYGED